MKSLEHAGNWIAIRRRATAIQIYVLCVKVGERKKMSEKGSDY